MTISEASSRWVPLSGQARLAGVDILILDADPLTAALLREMAEQTFGAIAEVVATLDEALDVLGNTHRPIRLCLLDTAPGERFPTGLRA